MKNATVVTKREGRRDFYKRREKKASFFCLFFSSWWAFSGFVLGFCLFLLLLAFWSIFKDFSYLNNSYI